MGKPGARITDLAGHGGMITGPGVPMVMVGKMPAATLGDMHVCPMVTGVVPHVGGPTTLGSMGVLIGKKPAARIGDLGVCVGPPGTVAMGAVNVLIGEMGGAGGGGAAAAAAAALAAKAGSPADIEAIPLLPDSPPPDALHFVRFRFTDAAGLPLAAVPFRMKGPDGAESEGMAGPEGEFMQSGFAKAGSFSLQLRGFSDAKWKKDAIQAGEDAAFSAKAEGFTDGDEVMACIVESVGGAGGRLLEQMTLKVQGSKVEGIWKKALAEAAGTEEEGQPLPEDLEPLPARPVYQFLLIAGSALAVSPGLKVTQDLQIQLVDEKDEAIADTSYRVESRTGEVFEGRLNRQGEATVKELMPGWHQVRFPDFEEPDPATDLRAAVLEVEDQTFRHDSAVFLPNAQEQTPPNGARAAERQEAITGLAVLKTALLRLTEFPDQALFILGHTDTSGDSGYNLGLSSRRAESVVLLLEGAKAAWATLCHNKHKVADIKQILAWAAITRAWDCDPGAVNETWNPQARDATNKFQTAYNLEFPTAISVDGIVGIETWGAFFDLYQAELADMLATDIAGLDRYRARLRWKDPRKFAGCGENWPIEAAEQDNYRSQTNRRIELLFFDPGETLALHCHAMDGTCRKNLCPLYPPRPGARTYVPVHPHPLPQSTPTFFTKEKPGAENFVRMHTLKAYLVLFADDQSLESARRFDFHEGKLCAPGTTQPVAIDCDREAYFYFSHRDDFLSLNQAELFKADRSGLPLLGPVSLPCGPAARIELDIWQQNDWAIVHGVRVEGERPDEVLMAEWNENYSIGYSAPTQSGESGFFPYGNNATLGRLAQDYKDSQHHWMGRNPIPLLHLGNPDSNPMWVGTLSALPRDRAKILLVHDKAGRKMHVGSFNEVAPNGRNHEWNGHHTYDRNLVNQLLALPAHGQTNAQIDALPAPRSRVLLPGDMCWQDQGQTNNCGAFSFSTAMNYWFPYTCNPLEKDGTLFARPGNVDDTINGARTPADIATAAIRFRMNGRDNDAEDLDRARAMKLVKLWLQAGVPVVFLVKEEYNLWSYHWKTLAGFDGDHFYMNNSGADREVLVRLRRPGMRYEFAPVGNDVDAEVDFYGKWRAAGGDIVDAVTSVDECTFLPLFPQDGMFAGDAAR